MSKQSVVMTSIADSTNQVINILAQKAIEKDFSFILIGDEKSTDELSIPGCDFYSIERQMLLPYEMVNALPTNQYSRKNLGYLLAIQKGSDYIVETDDDNYPQDSFWKVRNRRVHAKLVSGQSWINVYRFFSNGTIWPRGFPLDLIQQHPEHQEYYVEKEFPIQQGLVDINADVDAVYRLVFHEDIQFAQRLSIGLGEGSFCPFNSQNTTWFKEAFPLLYLPSYCTFRMTDIWRSMIAQRIAWSCGWQVLFHSPNMEQVRNEHNLLNDFEQEIPGYLHNKRIADILMKVDLRNGAENLGFNLIVCYAELCKNRVFPMEELNLVKLWIKDLEKATQR